MPTVTADLPEALDQKILEYARAHGMVRNTPTEKKPNKAEAIRAILWEFFQLEEGKKS
jgi:hypothetical protein